MIYILIIMSLTGKSVATAEFNGYERCQSAVKQIELKDSSGIQYYKAICVERGR